MKKSLVWMLVLVVSISMVLTLSISACKEIVEEPSAEAEEEVTEEVETVEEVSEEVEPIVFGGSLPLTGWGSDAARYNEMGYRLWAKIINEEGGLLGRPVELLIYDDQSDPTTTAKLYEKLITQDKVDVLLTTWSDDMTMPATTVAEKYKKPIVTGGATLNEIWGRGYKYTCGLLPSSYDYTKVVIQLFKDLTETGAIIYGDLTYTTGFGEGIEMNFSELGIEILINEAYAADTLNFAPILTKVKQSNPDFLACGTGFEDAIQIMKQSKEVDLNPKVYYLTLAPGEPEFVNVLGEDAEYVMGTTEWEPTLTYLPGFDEFISRYIDEYGEEPVEDSATAYGVCQVLQYAIEEVGELDDDKINDMLHTMEIVTVFGTYNVDETTGMQKGKELFAFQIQNGKREIVYPEESATSTLIFPTPSWSER